MAALWRSITLVEVVTSSGAAVRRLKGNSRTIEHYCLDVSDEPAVRRMFSEIKKQQGRLDGTHQ